MKYLIITVLFTILVLFMLGYNVCWLFLLSLYGLFIYRSYVNYTRIIACYVNYSTFLKNIKLPIENNVPYRYHNIKRSLSLHSDETLGIGNSYTSCYLDFFYFFNSNADLHLFIYILYFFFLLIVFYVLAILPLTSMVFSYFLKKHRIILLSYLSINVLAFNSIVDYFSLNYLVFFSSFFNFFFMPTSVQGIHIIILTCFIILFFLVKLISVYINSYRFSFKCNRYFLKSLISVLFTFFFFMLYSAVISFFLIELNTTVIAEATLNWNLISKNKHVDLVFSDSRSSYDYFYKPMVESIKFKMFFFFIIIYSIPAIVLIFRVFYLLTFNFKSKRYQINSFNSAYKLFFGTIVFVVCDYANFLFKFRSMVILPVVLILVLCLVCAYTYMCNLHILFFLFFTSIDVILSIFAFAYYTHKLN